MNLEDFRYPDWTNQWAGRWSILSFSYWGERYCRRPFLPEVVDQCLTQSIMIWREGKSFAYHRQSEKLAFGKAVKEAIQAGRINPAELCRKCKDVTDAFLNYVAKHRDGVVSVEEYKEFHRLLVEDYYPVHVMVKMVVDALEPELLEKYLPLFEEARVYAEPVFTQSEEFMRAMTKHHEEKLGLSVELILCSLKEEFEAYLQGKSNLPAQAILEERYRGMALLFSASETLLQTGTGVDAVEAMIRQSVSGSIIKGAVAFPGRATGKVRVVFDPAKVNDFEEGSILVSGMTRPEFLSLMKKAAAIVTDGGGILSHAAIVARELKKPCIIGTLIATKELKDGDTVEVDADTGTVKKIA